MTSSTPDVLIGNSCVVGKVFITVAGSVVARGLLVMACVVAGGRVIAVTACSVARGLLVMAYVVLGCRPALF